jgi:hypothetical protein
MIEYEGAARISCRQCEPRLKASDDQPTVRVAESDRPARRSNGHGRRSGAVTAESRDLDGARLALQRQLLTTGTPRLTPIQVTPEGVIWDGHHAVRVAAEAGLTVAVRVVPASVPWSGLSILQLPVR